MYLTPKQTLSHTSDNITENKNPQWLCPHCFKEVANITHFYVYVGLFAK